MNGGETFEFVAAVAGVSIGLAALLLLAAVAVIGTWRASKHASESSVAAGRASLTVEELARRLAVNTVAPTEDAGRFAELHGEAEMLIQQQHQLQQMARGLLDTMATESSQPAIGLDELESTINRLDATVSEMAASLANLIRLLDRQ